MAEALFDYTHMMTDHVGRFTIGFVGIGKDKAHSLGSGTLASYGNIGGVITCAHVIQELDDEFGLVCFPVRSDQVQMMRITASATDKLIVGPSGTECGPDLAFLRLSDSTMAALASSASVIDALKHRENALAGEPDDGARRVELICGVIDEQTTTHVRGTMAVTTFQGLLNAGRVVEKGEAHGFDLVRFEPVPDADHPPPKSYGGTSGGGLWRLYTDPQEDGRQVLKQARLVGVAFWEKQINSQMHIVCHGQQSVHRVLFEEIRKRWPV